MVKGNSCNFSFEGKSIPYSIRRGIEYNREETAVLMYWTVKEGPQSGAYRLLIFADGISLTQAVSNSKTTLRGSYKHASETYSYQTRGLCHNMIQPLVIVIVKAKYIKIMRLYRRRE